MATITESVTAPTVTLSLSQQAPAAPGIMQSTSSRRRVSIAVFVLLANLVQVRSTVPHFQPPSHIPYSR